MCQLKKIEFALFSVQNILYFFCGNEMKKKAGGKGTLQHSPLSSKRKEENNFASKGRVALAL
jgi:hypothetical protein